MRSSRLAAVSLVVVAVAGLSACAPPAVDQGALERWHAERAARGADDGSVTVLTSTALAGATGDRVGAIGYRADRDTAWSLTVHGDPVAP
ncbi:hypothetical protein [Clavibacter michiganensis]|uniref:hypothetical protein n=1 Tax=Clavibacter michiganensis TaxID=28447 RepID=UPI003EBCD5B3